MRRIRVDHGLGIWDGYVITIRPEPVFFFFFFFFSFFGKNAYFPFKWVNCDYGKNPNLVKM